MPNSSRNGRQSLMENKRTQNFCRVLGFWRTFSSQNRPGQIGWSRGAQHSFYISQNRSTMSEWSIRRAQQTFFSLFYQKTPAMSSKTAQQQSFFLSKICFEYQKQNLFFFLFNGSHNEQQRLFPSGGKDNFHSRMSNLSRNGRQSLTESYTRTQTGFL